MTQKLTIDTATTSADESLSECASPCPSCDSRSTRRIVTRNFRGRPWTLARCDSCKQHFTSPKPTEADIANFYAGDYHAALRVDAGSERAFGAKYDRYLNTLARFVPTGRVLDIGCATGLLVKRLADRGYDATGIELNTNSADYGRSTFGIDIRKQPLEACGFDSNSFDAVFMTDVLEHTHHPRTFLREVSRILRVGGCAVITFPDIRSIESRYLFAMSRLLKRDWIWNTCHIPLHTWEFTRPTATALFQSAGFDVISFSRSQPAIESQPSPLLTLIHAPIHLLSLPLISRKLGTQMEFVIRKRESRD